jgi:predicted dehydrogenase
LLQQTGVTPIVGGLASFLDTNTVEFTHAIVATSVDSLLENTICLLNKGIINILVEKPAALNTAELKANSSRIEPFMHQVFVAYNRRFYSSVQVARQLIQEDGGLRSMHFEFTEWVHKIDASKKAVALLNNWFYANSTHVVDLAFALAGKPLKMSSFVKGGALPWHSITNFAGSGITENGVLFSYLSNWESAGRWAVELLTDKRRIFLKPLETVGVQWKGKIDIEPCEIDNTIDLAYKPGLFSQTSAFLSDQHKSLLTLADHIDHSEHIYEVMLNGNQN